jgi:hypothetical protein
MAEVSKDALDRRAGGDRRSDARRRGDEASQMPPEGDRRKGDRRQKDRRK